MTNINTIYLKPSEYEVKKVIYELNNKLGGMDNIHANIIKIFANNF